MNTFGFLTVIESERHGLFGGLLLLNRGGRPTEFHCTAPVQPNRAQDILYGPTLRPYLFNDLIGTALFKSAKSSPLVTFVDLPLMLGLRSLVDFPIALLEGESSDAAAPEGAHSFSLQGTPLLVEAGSPQDREAIQFHWKEQSCQFDLAEPFERIREAIEEAQRSAA